KSPVRCVSDSPKTPTVAMSSARPSQSSVGAVVVTFHPDAAVEARLMLVIRLVSRVLVVDNGSSDKELAPVKRLADQGIVDLLRNDRNLGLATALNQGFEWGEERGLSWMLTL